VAHTPNRANGPDDDDAPTFEVGVTDSRRAMGYLVAPGSDDYIRIMAVLESSVTDLTPGEIAVLVSAAGPPMADSLVQKRLDKLKDWTAATGRSDPSRIRRHADILARKLANMIRTHRQADRSRWQRLDPAGAGAAGVGASA
jgi:hypothetical protein